jgi:flagellar biogenesis protein FliO
MKTSGFRRGATMGFHWLATGACALAQTTHATVETAPLPDVSGSVARVFGALALVLALFFGGVWLFKNWQRFSRFKGRPARLGVLETRALDNRHTLYVIGYQRQRMLVGTSPTGITLISELPDEEAAEAGSPPDFATALGRAVERPS